MRELAGKQQKALCKNYCYRKKAGANNSRLPMQSQDKILALPIIQIFANNVSNVVR